MFENETTAKTTLGNRIRTKIGVNHIFRQSCALFASCVMKGVRSMFTLLIILVTIAIIVAFMTVIAIAGGSVLLLTFGDLIIAFVIIYALVKIIRSKKRGS